MGQHAHQPAVRPALRAAALDHLDAQREPVAGANGAQEVQPVDPRRGDQRRAPDVAFILHALHQGGDLPAARDQAAEFAAPGGGGVGVNRHRVERPAERDDARLAHRRLAPFEDRAGSEVLEIERIGPLRRGHCGRFPAPAGPRLRSSPRWWSARRIAAPHRAATATSCIFTSTRTASASRTAISGVERRARS